MCGIYGTIGKHYREIEKFSEFLHHRGPDASGFFIENRYRLALGHTRLSIIDLSSQAHQPMKYGDYVLVFNGEVYNYQEIRNELKKLGYEFSTNSDTEVVLKSYVEWKEGCLARFRGMFALSIFDKRNEQLFLARDRFGIKPLLYSFENDQFIFASELKPFLKSNFISKRLNHEAVSDYFCYGSVKQPHTMLDGVYHLMPGHFMKVRTNKDHEIHKFYDLVEESKKLPLVIDYKEAVKRVRRELETATKYSMVADVEVGAFLSGGIDSTAVVAMMKHYTDSRINTFSVGFKEETDIEDETAIASRTARRLGCNHHNIKLNDQYIAEIFDNFIEAIDQPSIDGINTYIVSRETSKEMKVALSGLGGDEIFAGYPHFKSIYHYASKRPNLVSYLGKAVNKIAPNRFTNHFQFYGVREEEALEIQRTIQIGFSGKNNRPNIAMYDQLTPVQRISKAEIDNYMLNTLLRDSDAVSMANSLEVRPILLDHKLTELVFSLKDEFKLRDGVLKSVLIDSVKDIIPEEVWKRDKTGFEMPFTSWLNGWLNIHFYGVTNNKEVIRFFKPAYLKALRGRIRDRKLQRKDWMDLVFLSWIERFQVEL